METYLNPTQHAGRAFMARGIRRELFMLNLLRFREVADYSAHPRLAPERPISGSEAFDRYIAHTAPFLARSRGAIAFLGTGGHYLIGPPGECWDLAMLVRQRSADSFMAFASDAEYLAGLGHREAALLDSRLLPLVPRR